MIFNLSNDELKQKDAYATASEINQQPKTWRKTKQQFETNKKQYLDFVSKYQNDPKATIVFAGAGSSEFVGNVLVENLQTFAVANVVSIATTNLLTDVSQCLLKDAPTLMVSFGRSGNSPESVGAFLEVQNYCTNVEHLFITCNENGKLAKLVDKYDNVLSIELTPETHDVAFAMTSSFSNMYLMASLIFDSRIEDKHIDMLISSAESFLETSFHSLINVADAYNFKRIVYLGSHALKGIAQEAALKVLELTSGIIPSLFDTFLGFRHGPKSFLDKDTLSVIMMSNQANIRRYELDLLKEMSQEENKGKILVFDTLHDKGVESLSDYQVQFEQCDDCPINVLALLYLMGAQSLGLFKSMNMKITPDNPDPTGSVNRVVKGVTLYNEGEQQ